MSRYTERVAAGLCGMCGSEEPIGPLCQECRDKSKQRQAVRRKKLKASNKCITCGKDPLPNQSRCEKCAERSRKDANSRTRRRRAAGQCLNCGKPPKPGCVSCQDCISKMSKVSSKKYQERKAAGKTCVFCSRKQSPGQKLCEYHREKYSTYRRALKLKTFEAYGGPKCAGCDSEDVYVLEIDHVKGGGRKHLREIGLKCGGYSFYLWLRKNNYPPGFRVLCPTCNKKAYMAIPLPSDVT